MVWCVCVAWCAKRWKREQPLNKNESGWKRKGKGTRPGGGRQDRRRWFTLKIKAEARKRRMVRLTIEYLDPLIRVILITIFCYSFSYIKMGNLFLNRKMKRKLPKKGKACIFWLLIRKPFSETAFVLQRLRHPKAQCHYNATYSVCETNSSALDLNSPPPH